jgi:hypothetical protein
MAHCDSRWVANGHIVSRRVRPRSERSSHQRNGGRPADHTGDLRDEGGEGRSFSGGTSLDPRPKQPAVTGDTVRCRHRSQPQRSRAVGAGRDPERETHRFCGISARGRRDTRTKHAYCRDCARLLGPQNRPYLRFPLARGFRPTSRSQVAGSLGGVRIPEFGPLGDRHAERLGDVAKPSEAGGTVSRGSECPRRVCAVLRSTPSATRPVALARRRSWNLSPPTPAASQAGSPTRGPRRRPARTQRLAGRPPRSDPTTPHPRPGTQPST